MSTRSVNNPRTRDREFTGAARKSASSAKPARAAASSVRVVPASSKERRRAAARGESLTGLSKEEKRARKREERAQEDRIYNASTIMLKADVDYTRRRRMFWTIIVVGLSAAILLMILYSAASNQGLELSTPVQIGFLVVAYAAIFGALIYDVVRINPLRKFYRTRAEGMTEAQLRAITNDDSAIRERRRTRRDKKGADAKAAADEAAREEAGDTQASTRKRGPRKNNRSRR